MKPRPADMDVPPGSHGLMSLAMSDPAWPPGFLPIETTKALIPALERVIRRSAAIELGRESWKGGFPKEITSEMPLLTRIRAGSAIVDVLEGPPVQVKMDTSDTLGQKAVERLANAITDLRSSKEGRPSSTDHGLLDALDDVASAVAPAKQAEWNLYRKTRVESVPLTKAFRDRIKSAKAAPFHRYREIHGHIHMVKDAPKPRASIETPEGITVQLEWDERFRAILSEAFEKRRPVVASGSAAFDPKTSVPRGLSADRIRFIEQATAPGVRVPDKTPRDALLGLKGRWVVPETTTTSRVLKKLRRLGWGD